MFVCGLTGGIGSGKSTVAAGLAKRGADVIDADLIARDIVLPGRPAYHAIVERFGPSVVGADGALDRAALAAVVFSDDDARADLNQITHPAVGDEMRARMDGLAGRSTLIVLDIPLLAAATIQAYRLSALVVVDTPVDVAVTRLVGGRGFSEVDARARIAAQMSREERRALLDLVSTGIVVDNSGDRQQLERRIDEVWETLIALA